MNTALTNKNMKNARLLICSANQITYISPVDLLRIKRPQDGLHTLTGP